MRGYPGVSRFVVRHRLTRRDHIRAGLLNIFITRRASWCMVACFLGHYDNPEEAAAAYIKAKVKKRPPRLGQRGGQL